MWWCQLTPSPAFAPCLGLGFIVVSSWCVTKLFLTKGKIAFCTMTCEAWDSLPDWTRRHNSKISCLALLMPFLCSPQRRQIPVNAESKTGTDSSGTISAKGHPVMGWEILETKCHLLSYLSSPQISHHLSSLGRTTRQTVIGYWSDAQSLRGVDVQRFPSTTIFHSEVHGNHLLAV
jgi:hypothetical protein